MYLSFRARSLVGVATICVLGLLVTGTWFYRTSTTRVPEFVVGTIDGVSLKLELALTDAERERGLGGRVSLPEDQGMYFGFTHPGRYGFWMKDTLIPLDIFWLNRDGEVVFLKKNIQPDTYPEVFYPDTLASYVLETNAGFSDRYGVKVGSVLSLQTHVIVSE